MPKSKYYSPCGGSTTGQKTQKTVRYPRGVFEAEAGDLDHCSDVEKYQPNKKPDHYAAGLAVGIIDEKADEEVDPAYETRPMKPARSAKSK